MWPDAYTEKRCTREINVNANSPLAAAKKIWRMEKHLNLVNLQDIGSGDEYQFHVSQWMAHSRGSKRKFR